MLKRLRRSMTLLCAGITGIILLVMSLVSLRVSEGQLTRMGEAMFQSNLNTIAFRLRNDALLDWDWLAETEADGQLIIHLEDNGTPFLFSGSWSPPTNRQLLINLAQSTALTDYAVDARQRPRSSLRSNQALFSLEGDQGESYRAAVVVMRTELGYKSLTLLGYSSNEQRTIHRQRLIFGGISLGALLLLLAFSWWFAGRAIQPVDKSQRRQAEFIAAASHELRTPLAVIRTSASALGYGIGQDKARFVSAIDRECARTGKLVDDLLMLANADAQAWSVTSGPVEPALLLGNAVDSFSAQAQLKNIRLSVVSEGPPPPIIAGDAYRLEQLLSILLDNACHYTPQGGSVTLQAKKQNRSLRLLVADTGPGIPDSQKESVFERFYRADASRGKKEHYGLGLSIAAEIVRLHKGRISLLDTPGGGLTVAVDLPLSLR